MFAPKSLDSFLDLFFDGVIITDRDGLIIKVNSAYQRMTGKTAEELVGKDIRTTVGIKLHSNESSTIRVLEEKRPVTIIQRAPMGNGYKEYMTTGMPMFNDQNEIEYVVNCVRDMTELNELKQHLSRARQMNQNYLEEIETLRQQVHKYDFVAHSKVMLDVRDAADKVASVDSPVMLRGESGVGKEVIAKYIHHQSKRSKGAFIKVNCGAIPASLMESEFFGYESGAFTGASKEGKPGYFEMADKGTLFLDEIGDMPLDLQVKLLRALEEQEFRRVGGVKTIRSDVRIIAATNQDLEEMVAQKEFRKDLYYRLQVYPIHIPPLRERKEEIPFFIEHFLQQYQEKNAIQIQLTREATQLLYQYDWPGNIRELINVMERMAISCANGEIRPEHLPREMFGNLGKIIPKTFQEEVELFEFQGMKRALTLHKSTRKAAKALQMSQPTFVRKMKQYEEKYKCDPKVNHQ
ncbi:sigma-54 interaction domain-containing protein [Brevibacillus porteri]|uniref:HTH-type transcriptional regulatory protein TyrR n=1 Tax=Brevibacillus porteri TaxID=2126350 RepID=A0ABX5FMW2_9BACL|nr:sigma 54-interacting transcriptional regulator [Brevibacillus porteri]MED1799829.1 sigma 54-interacting transcriptional regulator [Brevibacillus porteri]MED2132853.1 sigma 54-interacting transcriptional regulator [Brevibacillus porteri]MED2744234.1 sigma 54-interacting transcriptional regulator [Brevibacillus porteri]MED2816726.1 sigma 54-interacting transcriptional regulator [Brevibacillus porteri]MED2894300.1 sigma 54-interacting transcriptional regulator [Brevibacillus porteri]